MKNYSKLEIKNVSNTDQAIIDKVWSRITIRNDSENCWEWDSDLSLDKDGYPIVNVAKKQNARLARFVWQTCKSSIPVGLSVLHTCHNRKCGRPTHLRLGTARDNAMDKIAVGHSCAGSSHWKAKLNEEQVAAIRSIHAMHKSSITQIAKMFGCSVTNISLICSGQAWKRSYTTKAA